MLNQVHLPYVLDCLYLLQPPCIPSVPCAVRALSHMATSWCNALPFDLAASSDLLSIFKVRLKTFLVIFDFILCVVFDVQIHVKVASISW